MCLKGEGIARRKTALHLPSYFSEINITSEEVKKAVSEATEIVRQQIEVIEPHVFKSGK